MEGMPVPRGLPTRCAKCLSLDLEHQADGSARCRACGHVTPPAPRAVAPLLTTARAPVPPPPPPPPPPGPPPVPRAGTRYFAGAHSDCFGSRSRPPLPTISSTVACLGGLQARGFLEHFHGNLSGLLRKLGGVRPKLRRPRRGLRRGVRHRRPRDDRPRRLRRIGPDHPLPLDLLP